MRAKGGLEEPEHRYMENMETKQQGTERTERTEEGARERGATTMSAMTTMFGDHTTTETSC